MKKILVVDNEKVLRNILKDKLTEEKYTILEAESGAECLKILENESVDLVLLDIIMPVMSGVEVVKEITKSETITKKPPIIVLSNKSDLDTVADIMSNKMCNYLIKSDNSLESIVNTVKETLAKA